jgi:DNA-binding PucR family transcriptional regulator
MDGSRHDREGSREEVAAVAARLGRGLTELASDIRATVESAVPALRENAMNSLTEASVQQNVDTVLGILAHGIDQARVDPPSAAVEHARRLAQRGIPTFALIRAYRLGQNRFLVRLIEDLVRHGAANNPGERVAGEATLEMVQRVAAYVDHVVEELVVTYARAREEWLNPNAILRARVQSVLYDDAIDLTSAQAQLGEYALRQHHLGVQIWAEQTARGVKLAGLRGAVDALATAIGCHAPALFVPLDESSAWAWFPLAGRTSVDGDLIAAGLAGFPGIYAAAGEPLASLAGFRRTHEQAVAAAVVAGVAVLPRERLTPYAEIAPIAAMSHDLESARAWVSETLGPLATDDERHARLRETARVFLTSGGSFAATAERLHLHRNTAQYRLKKAEEIRGRAFRLGRLDVELALLACHWFGSAVLRPAGARPR